MRVDLFDFELPDELVALRPAEPRETARLLVVDGDELTDAAVGDLPAFLRPGDLLVFNDTKVIPAQLTGRRGAARIELTLHRRLDAGYWRAFARPAERLHPGDQVIIAEDFAARVVDRGEGGEVTLDFACTDAAFFAALARHGTVPLPPYIRKHRAVDARDRTDYQTMFAVQEGAVAAPTAGLHFTPDLLARLAAAGIATATLTLHVGAGTFLPVSVDDTADHRMHAEFGEISATAAAAVNDTRAGGGRVIAVGTTCVRLLEAAADITGEVRPFHGDTDIFITPGYVFRVVDLMLTNFHLPRSTLFMLVSAFAGLEVMQAAYRHAIARRYRFYSYGDACLLHRGAA